MSAITDDEILPGLVAFLDQPMIEMDRRVSRTKKLPDANPRLFVCYARSGDTSEWSPITTRQRPTGYQRLRIERQWRSGGDPQWLRDDQYLNDGANTYRGPNRAFVDASHLERTEPGNRARVSAEGIGAILAEIERQVGRQDPP